MFQAHVADAPLLDTGKHCAHGTYASGQTFVPANVKTHGHRGRPIMRCLRTLSNVTSARYPAITKRSFLASAHQQLSVAVV
jgi:hypothetical protein